MSQDDDKSQKTEEPTPKKLEDARKKGNVPSSKEVGTVMSVFVLMAIVTFMSPSIATGLSGTLKNLFASAGTMNVGSNQQGISDVSNIIGSLAKDISSAIGPMFLLMMIAAVFGVLVQGETVVANDRIQPKLSNISPLKGLKKIFSVDSLVEFIKSVLKVAAVSIIAYFVIASAIMSIFQTTGFIPESIPGYIRNKAGLILLIVSSILVPLAIYDIIWKRAQWIKQNKMSMKEIKDEHKDMEGDPHMKQKRSEKRRQLSQKRMLDVIPKATVILTNPTHYSVALKYERGTDLAPIVIAKGKDSMAKKIREIAKENNVPMIENKPLARALHATAEVDDVIPTQHWQAIAEIISYVIDLKNNVKRKAPDGSSIREDV